MLEVFAKCCLPWQEQDTTHDERVADVDALGLWSELDDLANNLVSNLSRIVSFYSRECLTVSSKAHPMASGNLRPRP